MHYIGEDKYDLDKIIITPGYFRGDNIFKIKYEEKVYTISYGR